MELEHDQRGVRPINRSELLGILCFWTFIAALSAANRLLEPREAGAASVGFVPVLPEVFEAYLWAPFTVLVFWLTGRMRIDRTHWLRPAGLLLVLGLFAAVFVDVAEDIFELHVLNVPTRGRGTSVSETVIHLWFLNEFLIYAGLVAAGFARAYFLRYHARQDEAVRLQARASKLEAQLAEARLDALRMQVNPHFLFNALHAISSMVQRDPNGVRGMIANLASLLRATLRTGAEPFVTLERELEFLERYLAIMHVRFQGRLEVDFDVEPDVLDALVPNLILQPLVENAVKHGISEIERPGRIEVTAAADGDQLIVCVLDDGPGLPPPVRNGAGGGIGLENVRQRLLQLYGGAARLSLENRVDGGVRAEVRLPLQRERVKGAAPAVVAAEVS